MKINPKQLKAVIALPGKERYKNFIKVIADTQKVWGLYQDGWALSATDDGVKVFNMWPAREYAEICAVDEWKEYAPKDFHIDELINELLPKLKKNGVLAGVFLVPGAKGVTPSLEEIERDLKEELRRY